MMPPPAAEAVAIASLIAGPSSPVLFPSAPNASSLTLYQPSRPVPVTSIGGRSDSTAANLMPGFSATSEASKTSTHDDNQTDSQSYWASNQQSAEPIVFVGPVELLQTTMPFANVRPYTPKSRLKFDEPETVRTIAGTAVSAGSEAASCTWMNWAEPLLLYPCNPNRRAAEAETIFDAAYAAVVALRTGPGNHKKLLVSSHTRHGGPVLNIPKPNNLPRLIRRHSHRHSQRHHKIVVTPRLRLRLP